MTNERNIKQLLLNGYMDPKPQNNGPSLMEEKNMVQEEKVGVIVIYNSKEELGIVN